MKGNAKLIAWSYKGNVHLLDDKCNSIKKLTFSKLSIRTILQISNSLYLLANRNNNNGEIESLVIQYDFNEDKEKQVWTNSELYIWSIAKVDNSVIVISSKGELLKLESGDLKAIANYPEMSRYIPVSGAEPIICVTANLTKLHWKSAYCYRDGKSGWKREGRWLNMSPPFLCNNYLIQENEKSNDQPASIAVIDILNGKQISESKINTISSLNCTGIDIIYAINSSIIIRKLPSLEIKSKFKTHSKVKFATIINGSVYFIDKNRIIHKLD
jgi:hypothetical protein